MLILILVMGVLDATRVYRLSRAVAVDINVMDYVEAARLRGENIRWIIFREILPNALSSTGCRAGLAVHLCGFVLIIAIVPWVGRTTSPKRIGAAL